jgi:predicted transcriptional regulator
MKMDDGKQKKGLLLLHVPRAIYPFQPSPTLLAVFFSHFDLVASIFQKAANSVEYRYLRILLLSFFLPRRYSIFFCVIYRFVVLLVPFLSEVSTSLLLRTHMSSGFGEGYPRRGRYTTAAMTAAKLSSSPTTGDDSDTLLKPFPSPASSAADRASLPVPTKQELEQLSVAIPAVLASRRCLDVMGQSTQVVVVEVDNPLTVAFVAGQETKISTVVLWDSKRRAFVGVMPPTEYIKVLLYCHDHPEEADAVTKMTVRQWRDKVAPSYAGPEVTVAVRADDFLGDAFARMRKFNVRRALVLAEKEADLMILSVMSYQIISQFLIGRLLSLGDENEDDTQTASSGGGLVPASVRSIVSPTFGISPGADGKFLQIPQPVPVGPYQSILDVPLSHIPQLGANRRKNISVTVNTKVVDALRQLLAHKIQSIPIVDEHNIVIDCVSRTDVMRMESNGVFDINTTVREALSFRVTSNIFVCHETDTIRDILLHFYVSRLKELYLVDPAKDVLQGQIGLSEVLKFLCECGDEGQKAAQPPQQVKN